MEKCTVSLMVLVIIFVVGVAAGPVTESYDLSVAKAKIKPTSASAGDSVKVTFTVQNAGPAESPATKANIIFVLESKDKSKSGKGISVRSLDLEPMAASTKNKLSTKIEIGENLAKGTYQIKVVLDAGESEKDAKPANNTAKCKKLLVIK